MRQSYPVVVYCRELIYFHTALHLMFLLCCGPAWTKEHRVHRALGKFQSKVNEVLKRIGSGIRTVHWTSEKNMSSAARGESHSHYTISLCASAFCVYKYSKV